MKDGEVISESVGEPGKLLFICPGCKCGHGVWTQTANELTGARWTWNGDKVKPTFSPSLLVTMEWEDSSQLTDDDYLPWSDHPTVPGTKERNVKPESKHKVIPHRDVCHSFVREGMIQFLSDCTHALAGQTVPLKPL